MSRDAIPPPSHVLGPTVEQLADIERARRDLEDGRETLVACPSCASCALCRGEHMVTPEQAHTYADAMKCLEEVSEP